MNDGLKRLRVLLFASILSTAIHYTHNFIYINDYPQNDFINRPVVAIAWIGFTAIGLLAYRLYAEGRPVPAAGLLVIYSYAGLSSLGHYLFGPLSAFWPTMHATILPDGITGAAILVFALVTLQRALPRNRLSPHLSD